MFKNYLERIVHAMSDNDQDAFIVIEIDAWHNFYNDKITYKELCLIRNLIAYAIQIPSAQPEIIRCEECIHNGSFDTDCPIIWNGKEYCSFAEKSVK